MAYKENKSVVVVEINNRILDKLNFFIPTSITIEEMVSVVLAEGCSQKEKLFTI